MALNIISKQMANTAESYAEVVGIITEAWAWDEVVESTEDGFTEFRKYCDAEHTKYAGIRLQSRVGNSYNHYFYPVCHNGTVEGIASYTTPASICWNHLNIVADAEFLCIHGSYSGLPDASARFLNVGIAKSTNMLTGEPGYAAWETYNSNSNANVDSNFALMGAAYDGDGFALYRTEPNGRIMIAQRLANLFAVDVPDKPLLIETTTESHFNSAGYCTFGGKKYYKNGCILLPAE